ncbi:NAD(P)/FAD-dependent oxidoreductase [Helicobacter cappadocius]|uniref:NAD(P)/FAD-dependent oxidoreductase n=1 Tax=Helicobacter cappadocius TaxID=3063998 RepID=A0AA90SST3_9HELI|nr:MULTISPECIES: NAD(P)/FAD-dependent oxidoreductase [unclassified Helicobacter]MDO7253286.1 NAD(P)/FAD-dependent oxidoreductase [Helicobacter sp. faydin-H75]MDP2539284.1 NAD(P)/FAD-dependent oxidoreductase [Helicobacter sp. faydin-H76]
MQKPRILLLGAGYGCLSAVKKLTHKDFTNAQITLISNQDYHYHTVLLHEVASGAKLKGIKYPLKDILPSEITFIQDTITQIQPSSNQVIGQNGIYDYDYLVIGLGFDSDSFGIKGIEEYSLSMTSYESSINIKNHIDQKFENYKNNKDINELKFIICGGGFSGVEFATSLAQELNIKAKKADIPKGNIKISCIEAMPHILPMFDNILSTQASKRLQELGIEVLENSKILECLKDGVIIEKDGKSSKIHGNTIIWSAGVKGNKVIQNSTEFQSARSKIEIDEYLHPKEVLPNRDKIFIVGDCGALKDPKTGRFHAPTAQISVREGAYVGETLHCIIQGHSIEKTFYFEPKGSICSLGKGYGLGIFMDRKISGSFAYTVKRSIENLWVMKLKSVLGIF